MFGTVEVGIFPAGPKLLNRSYLMPSMSYQVADGERLLTFEVGGQVLKTKGLE